MVRVALGYAALAALTLPSHAQSQSQTCRLTMICSGVWEQCEEALGPVIVQTAPDLITVTTQHATFTFDDVTGPLDTGGGQQITATGLDSRADPPRYAVMVLDQQTLGVIVSEDQTGTGAYTANQTFAADCSAD